MVLGDHAKSWGSASKTKLPSPTKASEARGIFGGGPTGAASVKAFSLSDCRRKAWNRADYKNENNTKVENKKFQGTNEMQSELTPTVFQIQKPWNHASQVNLLKCQLHRSAHVAGVHLAWYFHAIAKTKFLGSTFLVGKGMPECLGFPEWRPRKNSKVCAEKPSSENPKME